MSWAQDAQTIKACSCFPGPPTIQRGRQSPGWGFARGAGPSPEGEPTLCPPCKCGSVTRGKLFNLWDPPASTSATWRYHFHKVVVRIKCDFLEPQISAPPPLKHSFALPAWFLYSHCRAFLLCPKQQCLWHLGFSVWVLFFFFPKEH